MEFRPITIEDQTSVKEFCDKYGERSCQHTFIAMFSLCDKYGTEICIQNNTLFVLRNNLCTDEYRTYLFPMCESNHKEAVLALMDDAHSHGKKLRFETVTEAKQKWLSDNFSDVFDFEGNRDYAEYIYYSEKIHCMSNRELPGKRRLVNYFNRIYKDSVRIETLTKEHEKEILDFEMRWLEKYKHVHDMDSLMDEYYGLVKQLEYFDCLNLDGIVLYIDNEIHGVLYGCVISGQCFDGIFSKADAEFKGIYSVLHQSITEIALNKGCVYYNIEEDIGLIGLRENKLSYKPDILLLKYIATEK